MRVLKKLLLLTIVIVCISSIAFGAETMMAFVNRKASATLEVPSENRGEISDSNAITWEIANGNLAYFKTCNDFTATIVGVSGGETTIYCKQGRKNYSRMGPYC